MIVSGKNGLIEIAFFAKHVAYYYYLEALTDDFIAAKSRYLYFYNLSDERLQQIISLLVKTSTKKDIRCKEDRKYK